MVRLHPITAVLLVGMLLVSSVIAAIEARLDRESVPAGEGALLEVTITGASSGRPVIPAIEGFIVQPRGQHQKVEMFNGRTSQSTTYSYAVGSMTPGDYEIPPIEVTINGVKHETSPLRLKVTEPDAAQASPSARTPQTHASGDETDGKDRFGFLTVELADSERKHAYVGEIAPVRIRAWLPADAQANLRSGIQPEGSGFTLHNLSERPQQTHEARDGKRYVVVTWYGGISATKAGEHPVSLSVDLTVAVPDRSAPRRRRARGGPFDDPFFDSVFDRMNTPMIQKDVTLRSVDQQIEVRPLPAEGRPEGFTGAVGSFKFEGAQIPETWAAGEPQQVLVRLGGSGNFALMKAPAMTPPEVWKTYAGRDEFRAGDQASFSGNKTFQFNAMPLKSGEQQVALEFSFFDPAVAAYKTIRTAPQDIKVSGEDVREPLPASAVRDVAQPEGQTDEMVGLRRDLSARASLVPLVARPAFKQMLSTAAGLVMLGGLLACLRRHLSDPRRRARALTQRATRKALEKAWECAANRDVAGFFAAARLAIQQQLGAMWGQPALAITTAEVSARVRGGSPLLRFFQEADLHQYNRHATGEILPEWRTLLDEALASLNPESR